MEVVFKLLRHVTILVQMKLTLGRKRVEWPTSHRAHRLTLTRLVCSARLFDKPSTRFCHRQRKWSGVSNLSSLLHLCSTGPSIEFTFIYDWMWALSSRHAVSSFKKEFRWVYKRFHQLILYLLVPRMKFHGQKKITNYRQTIKSGLSHNAANSAMNGGGATLKPPSATHFQVATSNEESAQMSILNVHV